MCRLIHLKKADLSLKISQPVKVLEINSETTQELGKNPAKAQKIPKWHLQLKY